MSRTTDQIIADALEGYLRAQLRKHVDARTFFRISGFREESYIALLDRLASMGWVLADTLLELRSIVPIAGHEDRVMQPERSATSYRNTIQAGQALILIQNRASSDAQSLKDLFAITELSLSHEGVEHLIDASFPHYQLNQSERITLIGFVRQLARVRFEPQLRDLTEFYVALDHLLYSQPGTSIAHAITFALPYLGLFRCLELQQQLHTARGDKLIRQLHQAARIGREVLDERTRVDYLNRLHNLQDDDSAIGGLTADQKRLLVSRFIAGDLRDDHDAMLQVFQIEWREIQLVITAKSRVTRSEKMEHLAQRLEQLIQPDETHTASVAELIADLRTGAEPESELLDHVLADFGDSLPRSVRSDLRRLVKLRVRKHADFLIGITALAIELLHPLQGSLVSGTSIRLYPILSSLGHEREWHTALTSFHTLFGGIEQAFPCIQWHLEPLWEKLASWDLTSETEDDLDRERIVCLELPFRMGVYSPDGAEIAKADIVWQYRSDSPAMATSLTLAAEHAHLQQGSSLDLRIPVFNHCPINEEMGDFDVSRLVQSLGVWFEDVSDLRVMLHNALQRLIKSQAEVAMNTALTALERAWGQCVHTAVSQGLLATDIGALLASYEELLHTVVSQLQSSQAASVGFRVLNQAWLIGTHQFESWAVMPLLHPLKLHWWRERSRYFHSIIEQLLDPEHLTVIVDEARYRRELAATYGSSSFPAVLALPPGEGLPAQRFLPVEESDGYEFFLREHVRSEPFGLTTEALAEDEAELAAQRAIEGIIAVVQDYIETYPFVRDGLEIVLFECRNAALPELLVQGLRKAAIRRGWIIRLSIIIHTSNMGAPLFRRVSEWIAMDQSMSEHAQGGYFPSVSLKVLQCSYDELLQLHEDNDIIILADVLVERGQYVASELTLNDGADLPLEGFMPMYRALQQPFHQGEIYRRLMLSQPQQPRMLRLFNLAQHAALERRQVAPQASAHFYRELTLAEWERDLGRIHEHFNWVLCYDPTIDRFLLQAAFPGKVEVIRYSLGLGTKGQHNLTVSSSRKAQTIVERRLAARLAHMLPNASPDFRMHVAVQLVKRANTISGDIVLRAAGPGAFLNELIGLVAATFLTERRYVAHHGEALTTWILLDDFEHWFGGGKFPDLLFVAISQGSDKQLQLHLEILEAKCVGQLSFAVEATDAEEQVRRGVSRLAPAFAPKGEHLDAYYWYDQLYRAVVGTISVELEQQELWDLFQAHVHHGVFQQRVEGHVWAFCYDGQIGMAAGPDEHQLTKVAQSAADVVLSTHHYARNDLCQVLRALIEADGNSTTAEMWMPPAEEAATTAQQERIADEEASLPISGTDVGAEQTLSRAISAAQHPHQPQPLALLLEENTTQLPKLHTTTQLSDLEQRWLNTKARELERALRQRGVQIMPIDAALADVGPSIVRFKLQLRPQESVRKLQSIAEDLARDLALPNTPMIKNIQSSIYVGVDMPREQARVVELQPLMAHFAPPGPAELPIIIGVTPDGKLVIEDLSEFPHLLVAGATNSGKSVFLRSMLLSLMTQYSVGKLEILIIDPKRTDFTFFHTMPYLRHGKVLVEHQEARDALLELVRSEMPRRQNLIANRSMKIKLFNQRYPDEALPPIIALIDEYALLVSLMDRKTRDSFEQDLMILAAAARSVGIHLVLATQRPSADIVTSTLKANLDGRIAFRVASSTNARVVLDENGAENLLGRGDMLFRRPSGEIIRLQAPFMDEEHMQAYLAVLANKNHAPQS